MLEEFYKMISSEDNTKQAAEAINALAMATNKADKEEPKDKIMRFDTELGHDFLFSDLILERKNDDGSIHFFIIHNPDKTQKYTFDDFKNARRINPNDMVYVQVQNYCRRTYNKTINELAKPSIHILQKKVDALEKRIARLEEYADAIDMVAELINDVFPE